jgi:Tfp pilus assembly protein PilN
MQKINLLPSWVQQRKHRRRVIRILAVVQVVVFLLLGGVFYIVMTAESRGREYTAQLSRQLVDMDREPTRVAEAAREAENIQRLTADIMETRFAFDFDPRWLPAIIDTVPEGVALLSFDFSGNNIVLVAIASSLADIGTHQQRLEEIEMFGPVLYGPIVRMENGSVRYELRLGIIP